MENRGETSFFMTCHFDQTMAILILRFLCFCARKRITGNCFVIRINKMTYSKLALRSTKVNETNQIQLEQELIQNQIMG